MDRESEVKMAELTDNLSIPDSGGSHVLAATVAVVVSVVVHVGLVLTVSTVDLHWGSGSLSLERPPRRYEAVELGSVEISPDVQNEVLSTLRAIGSDAPVAASESLDDLRVMPEEAITEPPRSESIELAGESEPIIDPVEPPLPAATSLRQEIVAVESIAVKGDLSPKLERRHIPALERVPDAPDLLMNASRDQAPGVRAITEPLAPPTTAEILGAIVGGNDSITRDATAPEAIDETVAPGSMRELFEETVEDVTDVEPIEQVLIARVETYSPMLDLKYGYFKLEVERAGQELLPVRPKDILLVQDCSASMSEQRLFFCREGLRRSLAHIGTADRFNVARFADNVETCFDGWVSKSPESLEKAEQFINSMQAAGNTDLFSSMNDLLDVETDKNRPVIAFIITDGLANKGITDNSKIIGEFTRQNANRMSIFTMGTFEQANRYLIDLLSYCNKGDVKVVESGRWDIPVMTEAIMQEVSRPVLADLKLQFAADSDLEVYPQKVSNLYLDRPLVIYGRYKKGIDNQIVFQAVGNAGSRKCDLVFTLPLAEDSERRPDKSIRQMWAQQKIYHLVGEYARTGNSETLLELRRTARAYNEDIPYKKRLF